MKQKLLKLLVAGTIVLFMSSCGVNYALVDHQNQNSTQVHLTSNNYKVISRVSGTSEVEYIFFIGGLEKKRLFNEAYNNMLKSANLEGASKAVINILTEEHISGLPPFYSKRTVTVSGYVVAFEN